MANCLASLEYLRNDPRFGEEMRKVLNSSDFAREVAAFDAVFDGDGMAKNGPGKFYVVDGLDEYGRPRRDFWPPRTVSIPIGSGAGPVSIEPADMNNDVCRPLEIVNQALEVIARDVKPLTPEEHERLMANCLKIAERKIYEALYGGGTVTDAAPSVLTVEKVREACKDLPIGSGAQDFPALPFLPFSYQEPEPPAESKDTADVSRAISRARRGSQISMVDRGIPHPQD